MIYELQINKKLYIVRIYKYTKIEIADKVYLFYKENMVGKRNDSRARKPKRLGPGPNSTIINQTILNKSFSPSELQFPYVKNMDTICSTIYSKARYYMLYYLF